MKKFSILIVLFTFLFSSGHTQSLQLSNGQGIIPNNSEIIQAATPDSTAMSTYINVKNIGAATVNVYCKKIEYKLQDSTEVTMCWAGGCYPAKVFVSPNFQPLNSGETNTEFLGHYNVIYPHPHFVSGETVIRWTFFCKDNVNDSASVLVKYTSYPMGIPAHNKPEMSAIYPNPAADHAQFNVSVPSGVTGEVIIRDMVGKTVYTRSLQASDSRVVINTSSFSDGIYFCSLTTDGALVQTRKMVVKH